MFPKPGFIIISLNRSSKRLVSIYRYSADNDRRSSHYDDLLAAEDKALKSAKGLHDKKNIPTRRIADISGDLNKSKQFLPSLQRAGRMQVRNSSNLTRMIRFFADDN